MLVSAVQWSEVTSCIHMLPLPPAPPSHPAPLGPHRHWAELRWYTVASHWLPASHPFSLASCLAPSPSRSSQALSWAPVVYCSFSLASSLPPSPLGPHRALSWAPVVYCSFSLASCLAPSPSRSSQALSWAPVVYSSFSLASSLPPSPLGPHRHWAELRWYTVASHWLRPSHPAL